MGKTGSAPPSPLPAPSSRPVVASGSLPAPAEVGPAPDREATVLVVGQGDDPDEILRTLAGMAEYYEPDALVGRKVIMVANLAPRKMRGLESQGMLLAAEADGKVSLLQPDQDLPAGSSIR